MKSDLLLLQFSSSAIKTMMMLSNPKKCKLREIILLDWIGMEGYNLLIILKTNFNEWKIVYCFTYFWSAVHCIDVPREEFHSEFYCHEAKQRQHGGGTVEIFALDTSSCRYGPHPHSVSIIFRCTKGARPSSSPSALIRPCTIRDACFAMI